MWDLWKTRSSDKNNDNGKQSTENKLKKLCMEHTNSVAAQSNKNCTYYKMFDKLSWSTTGYHYDWTARRSYTEQNKSPMPKQMQVQSCLHTQIKVQILLVAMEAHDCVHDFNASASIINYYSLKSNMGGHRDDDLEVDFTKPVVSLSLGVPAVFLLGGNMKDDEVVPI